MEKNMNNMIVSLVALVLFGGGIWYLATGELPLKGKSNAPAAVAASAAAPAQAPAYHQGNGNAAQPATNVPEGRQYPQQQAQGLTVHINNGSLESGKKSPEAIELEKIKIRKELRKQEEKRKKLEEEKKAQEEKKKKEENLDINYKPNDPNPFYSWRRNEKVNAPVKYQMEVLKYLEVKKKEVEVNRFSIGVFTKEREAEYKKAQQDAKNSHALARKATDFFKNTKKDAWPVYFGYTKYDEEEFIAKLNELDTAATNAEEEEKEMKMRYDMAKHVLSVQNGQLDMFEKQIKTIKRNLELQRAGKITESTEANIEQLEKAMAESTAQMEESMRKAEQKFLKPYVGKQDEAKKNLEKILKKYAK